MDKLILGITQLSWRRQGEQTSWEQPTGCGHLGAVGISHFILQEIESPSQTH